MIGRAPVYMRKSHYLHILQQSPCLPSRRSRANVPERFRAFPSVSERFRAFKNFLTIPFTIAARAAHTSPIDITFRHNSFSNMKSTLPNISEHSLLIAPESHSGISFFLSNSFLLVSRKAPLLVK